jgi:hypothetical protein
LFDKYSVDLSYADMSTITNARIQFEDGKKTRH